MSDIEVTEISDGDWKEVVENKEAEVLQMMREYIQSKIADLNQQMLDLSNKRLGFREMESYVLDLQKVRGYDAGTK